MVIDKVETSIRKYAEKAAIVDCNGVYSYRQLGIDVNKVMAFCIWKGWEKGQRIGIYMEREYATVVTMLALLKLELIYIPLSKAYPEARLYNINTDCEMVAVVSDSACSLEKVVEVVYIQDILSMCLPRYILPKRTETIAYILYTSGSTGQPKGVCISYESLNFFVDWTEKEFEFSERDNVVSISSFSFDMSVLEIYTSLVSGSTIYIPDKRTKAWPNEFVNYLYRNNITILYAVPTFLQALSNYGGKRMRQLHSLRLVLFAGEHYRVSKFEKLAVMLPKRIKYFNLYGPTETNVCTYYRVENYCELQEFPIGKVIEGIEFDIVPLGNQADEGELVIYGPCNMECYWGETEKSEKFWYWKNGRAGYRTGDIVKKDAWGLLYLLGRKDSIFKVNGYRVSTTEIEQVILKDPGVNLAYVHVFTNSNVSKIIAFVQMSRERKCSEIRESVLLRCKNELPAYMLPSKVICVHAFPYTDSGKIDAQTIISNYDIERGTYIE